MTVRKKKKTQPVISKVKSKWLLALVLLSALEALVSAVFVFAAPSEGTNAWLLGLSATRWLLVVALLALFLVFCGLVWLNLSAHKFWSRFARGISRLVDDGFLYGIWMGSLILVFVSSFYTILLTFKFTDLFVLARLQRIFPIVLWIFLFCLQAIVVFPHIKTEVSSGKQIPVTAKWYPTGLAFLFLGLTALFVHFTRLGLLPDRVGWDNPGVPLLGTQIFTAICLALLLFGILWFIEKKFGWKPSRLDLLAAALLWLFAIWSWQSQPLSPTFFSPTPRAPNYEFYPYSDAATHDLGAENLLIGNGFPDVLEKPLYSFFLAGIHALVGQDYQNVVFAQIIILALFPVILYFLGSRLHNRISGAMIAFAVILREANGIALSGNIRVSHSKLLMTDLPATLGIAAFTLLVLRWLQSDKRDPRWFIGVGGALGVLALLRSQTIIFLPFLIVVVFLWVGTVIRKRFVQASVVLFGFALAMFPWLFRNYQVTGQFGYSQPLQAAYLAKQYSLTPELAETEIPQETPMSEYMSLGFSRVIQFTVSHPSEVAGFVSAHFFHNEVSSLLALPMRFDFADKLVDFYNLRPYWIGLEERLWTECCSLDAYIKNTPYWQSWNGVFPYEAWLPVIVNIGLISVGIGAAWKKVGWLAMVLISIHLIYNFSTAVARVSGWRLILPVDWILLLFYCLGITQIILWLWRYITVTRSQETRHENRQRTFENGIRWQKIGALAAVVFLVGVTLPLAEITIPDRFQPATVDEAQVLWDGSRLSAQSELRIADFLSQPGAEVLVGRALYPRFYNVNEGEPGGQGSPFNPLSFSRIAFSLIGPKGSQVALPLELAPATFPNASDVLIIGCDEDSLFRAAAVIFTDHSAPDLLSNWPDPFTCYQ